MILVALSINTLCPHRWSFLRDTQIAGFWTCSSNNGLFLTPHIAVPFVPVASFDWNCPNNCTFLNTVCAHFFQICSIHLGWAMLRICGGRGLSIYCILILKSECSEWSLLDYWALNTLRCGFVIQLVCHAVVIDVGLYGSSMVHQWCRSYMHRWGVVMELLRLLGWWWWCCHLLMN